MVLASDPQTTPCLFHRSRVVLPPSPARKSCRLHPLPGGWMKPAHFRRVNQSRTFMQIINSCCLRDSGDATGLPGSHSDRAG